MSDTPIAADGSPLRQAASTFGEFINHLEDGQLGADAYLAIQKMHEDMHDVAVQSGGIAKGKMTLTIDFKLEGAVFHIATNFNVKTDQPKRPRSVMWTLPDGRFTPHKPYQGELFGVRHVDGDAEIRRNF